MTRHFPLTARLTHAEQGRFTAGKSYRASENDRTGTVTVIDDLGLTRKFGWGEYHNLFSAEPFTANGSIRSPYAYALLNRCPGAPLVTRLLDSGDDKDALVAVARKLAQHEEDSGIGWRYEVVDVPSSMVVATVWPGRIPQGIR